MLHRESLSSLSCAALLLLTAGACSDSPASPSGATGPGAEVAGASGQNAGGQDGGQDAAKATTTDEAGTRASSALYFFGSPQQIGEQQAATYGADAQNLLDQWLTPKLASYGIIGQLLAQRMAGRMEPNVLQEHLDEVQAFAKKANIDYASLIIANGAADIMQLAAFQNVLGCSTFVVTPQRSATARMIVGCNLDYPQSEVLRKTWKPVVFARDGKLKLLAISPPGVSGVLTGINEKGVFLAIKVSHTGDSTSNGTPSGFIFREILEQATTGAEAVKIYGESARTVPLNITIVDPTEAYEFESDAKTFDVRRPSPTTGLLYGANHFESTKMPGGGPTGRDYRWPTLTREDSGTKKLGYDDVRKLIADAGGYVEGADGPSTNVFASFVEYGAKVEDTVVTYGGDPEGNAISANGKLTKVRLGDVFRKP